MTTTILVHRVNAVRLESFDETNNSALSIALVRDPSGYDFLTPDDFELTIFGLPTNIARALAEAIKSLPAPEFPQEKKAAIAADLNALAGDDQFAADLDALAGDDRAPVDTRDWKE